MDYTDPYSNSQGFVNLLSRQHDSLSSTIDLASSEVLPFSSQGTDDPSLAEDRKERRKWSPIEDVVLISAWLNTSKDPVISNEQNAGAFWKRIQAYFSASPQLARMPTREASHCKQRWGRLNEQVCKFVGCYEAASKEKTSGQNDNDVTKAALAIFFNDYNMRFTLENTWRELRHDQKWCSGSSVESAKKRKVDDNIHMSPCTEQVSQGEDVAMARPPGVKASKTQAKRSVNKDGNAMKEFESMCDIKRKDLELKEKLSKNKLLDSLLAKPEPLSEIEMALKNKLITEMLS